MTNHVERAKLLDPVLIDTDVALIGFDFHTAVKFKVHHIHTISQLISLNPQALLTFGMSKNQIFRVYKQLKIWFKLQRI